MSESRQVKVVHQRAPGFTGVVATGMVLAGPTPDGYVHITFYRDMLPALVEHFDVVETPMPDGSMSVTVSSVPQHPQPLDIQREDLVTVMVPVARFASFAQTIARHVADNGLAPDATPEVAAGAV